MRIKEPCLYVTKQAIEEKFEDLKAYDIDLSGFSFFFRKQKVNSVMNKLYSFLIIKK